jgi:hypothetical protein
MCFGSMPNDGGFLSVSKDEYLKLNQSVKNYIRPLIGGQEFIKGIEHYCIWITDEEFEDAIKFEFIKERITKVEQYRKKSTREATKVLAKFPYRFGEVRNIESDSIVVPATSSEKREYIPIGFLPIGTIIKNSAQAIYYAQPWIFGIVTSKIHNIWVRNIGGKLEERLRYSAALCYNTFPFPSITDKQKEQINLHVFEVLDERAKYSEKTLAQLYDPDKMPAGLKEAHHQLDLAIERCYRLKPFESDVERLEYLFKMYEEMTTKNSLFQKEKKTKKAK